jgi:hypothetical protein
LVDLAAEERAVEVFRAVDFFAEVLLAVAVDRVVDLAAAVRGFAERVDLAAERALVDFCADAAVLGAAAVDFRLVVRFEVCIAISFGSFRERIGCSVWFGSFPTAPRAENVRSFPINGVMTDVVPSTSWDLPRSGLGDL